MKIKHIIGVSIIFVIVGLGLHYSNVLYSKKGGVKMDYLKVEFYKVLDEVKRTQELNQLLKNPPENFDRKKHMTSIKYVGYAECKNGKLTIDVTDPKLEGILKSPFHAGGGRREGDRIIEEFVELKPGTTEHLGAISMEIQGYTAVTYDKEETKQTL